MWDPCAAAKKAKSLCDPPEENLKKKNQSVSNTSVKTETWCELNGCTRRPAAKRDGPGIEVWFLTLILQEIG